MEYLTPEEIAAILKVHPKTVRDWLRAGELKGIRLKGVWRVAREELDRFLKEREWRSGDR
jgi:excisionase family DNA binding protein